MWVGIEDTPIVFVNQMFCQFDQDMQTFILSMGEVSPPALVGAVQRRRETVVPGVETTSSGRSRAIPLFVPRDQLYYWTNRWQSVERAAVIELADGLGQTFADGSRAACNSSVITRGTPACMSTALLANEVCGRYTSTPRTVTFHWERGRIVLRNNRNHDILTRRP